MKSVLMIAYAFPPEGSAGTYRPLRFVRHLSKMGWRAGVISLDTAHYERYDPALLALVPDETTVVRVRGRDLWQAIQARRGRRLREKLVSVSSETAIQTRAPHHVFLRSQVRGVVRMAEAWWYHPDEAMPWIRPATEAAVNLCTRERSDVIWASAGPVSSLIVAQRASRRTRVPYVADFRDAWTVSYNEFEARRPIWATRAARRAMYQILEEARAVVFMHDIVAECYWRAYRGALTAAKIHLIPNGYDGDINEFSDIPKGDKCTILYAGTLSSYRYDTLLQALQLFKTSDPAYAQRLRLLFVGEGTERLANEAATHGLTEIVITRGPTSHAEISRLQQAAHALLILGRESPMKGRELFASAKLFGYLKTGRPIVGVLPPDQTKKILYRVGVSTVADADSPLEIIAVLRQVLDAWSEGTLPSLIPDRAECTAYSAERQTAALVRALEGAPSADPFIPGSVEIPPSLRDEIGKGGWVRGKDIRPLLEQEKVRARVWRE